jgi:hypothetical protein
MYKQKYCNLTDKNAPIFKMEKYKNCCCFVRRLLRLDWASMDGNTGDGLVNYELAVNSSSFIGAESYLSYTCVLYWVSRRDSFKVQY